jgi:hypothetical protein
MEAAPAMFDWFKKKALLDDPAIAAFARQLNGPSASVGALAEVIGDYTKEVRAGHIEYPAHKRENKSVVEVWRDARLEALGRLFNFGLSDPMLLAEHRRQLEILRCFLDERPQFSMPQPRGEIFAMAGVRVPRQDRFGGC